MLFRSVVLEMAVSNFLSGPQIDAEAHFKELALGQGLDALRRLGLGLVEGVVAEGTVNGDVSYAHGSGYLASLAVDGSAVQGKVEYRGGKWSGEVGLKSLSVPVDGVSDEVKIESASLSLAGDRVSLKKLSGTAGKVPFAGEFVWDRAAEQPYQLKLAVAEAEGDELVRLFTPLLQRQRGFIARTLGLGSDRKSTRLNSSH